MVTMALPETEKKKKQNLVVTLLSFPEEGFSKLKSKKHNMEIKMLTLKYSPIFTFVEKENGKNPCG